MINSYFLSQAVPFLEHNGYASRCPEILPTQVDVDGKFCSTATFRCDLSGSRLGAQPLLAKIVMFDALDALVDISYPELEGATFRQKCKNLPEETPREAVFKGVYRFYKTVRNALVHNKSGVRDFKGELRISYERKGRVSLAVSSLGMGFINAAALLLLKNPETDDRYFDAVVSSLYTIGKREVKVFADDIKGPCCEVSVVPGFKPTRRYRVDCTEAFVGARGFPVRRVGIGGIEKGFASDEFCFRVDGALYIVPGEVVGDSGIIHDELLKVWKVSPRNSLRSPS